MRIPILFYWCNQEWKRIDDIPITQMTDINCIHFNSIHHFSCRKIYLKKIRWKDDVIKDININEFLVNPGTIIKRKYHLIKRSFFLLFFILWAEKKWVCKMLMIITRHFVCLMPKNWLLCMLFYYLIKIHTWSTHINESYRSRNFSNPISAFRRFGIKIWTCYRQSVNGTKEIILCISNWFRRNWIKMKWETTPFDVWMWDRHNLFFGCTFQFVRSEYLKKEKSFFN